MEPKWPLEAEADWGLWLPVARDHTGKEQQWRATEVLHRDTMQTQNALLRLRVTTAHGLQQQGLLSERRRETRHVVTEEGREIRTEGGVEGKNALQIISTLSTWNKHGPKPLLAVLWCRLAWMREIPREGPAHCLIGRNEDTLFALLLWTWSYMGIQTNNTTTLHLKCITLSESMNLPRKHIKCAGWCKN